MYSTGIINVFLHQAQKGSHSPKMFAGKQRQVWYWGRDTHGAVPRLCNITQQGYGSDSKVSAPERLDLHQNLK